jgi:hypothetical protein
MCSKTWNANDDVLQRLADCRGPFLIGVRHHSAALARVLPQLLAEFRPQAILVLPEPILWSTPDPAGSDEAPPQHLATSLIPYSFAQLDQRSGYPAGVLDPVWQQSMLAAADPGSANQRVADLAVELSLELAFRCGYDLQQPTETEYQYHDRIPRSHCSS